MYIWHNLQDEVMVYQHPKLGENWCNPHKVAKPPTLGHIISFSLSASGIAAQKRNQLILPSYEYKCHKDLILNIDPEIQQLFQLLSSIYSSSLSYYSATAISYRCCMDAHRPQNEHTVL